MPERAWRPGPGLAAAIAVALLAAPARAAAAPYTPASDEEIVERLRERPLEPADRELRTLRQALRAEPRRLALAVAVAQHCIGIARRDGDPRYLGYAQAALSPWWSEAAPPVMARLMKATILQSVHEFDAAVVELDAVLQEDPANVQAWFTRASIEQVRGEYPKAERDCARVRDLGARVHGSACLAELRSLSGHDQEAEQALQGLLRENPDQVAWLSLVAAELAERRGDVRTAEQRYRASLAAASDAYAKGAWADFLLDRHRYDEVIALLLPEQRVDALLLRLALAFQGRADPRRDDAVAALQGRFDAARLRGDTVHQREEARFELHLRHRPEVAAGLAQRNWAVQREPADLRILLEAARAAHRVDLMDSARAFVVATGIDDVRLSPTAR
ncbi:MAG TPA: hypothetical protein VMU33_02675 [Burkholderiaceae bacterium]|nr:hypothetical protein [Burkholderiaceae bacterium]